MFQKSRKKKLSKNVMCFMFGPSDGPVGKVFYLQRHQGTSRTLFRKSQKSKASDNKTQNMSYLAWVFFMRSPCFHGFLCLLQDPEGKLIRWSLPGFRACHSASF